jgi:hypothetical protein
MCPVLLPPVLPTHAVRILQIQNSPQSLPPLSPGEILKANVIRKMDDGKVLISIADRQLLAETEAGLRVGDRLVLRVEQLGPRTVLAIVPVVTSEASVLTDYLKIYRSDPEALLKLVNEFSRLSSPEKAAEWTRFLAGEDVSKLSGILNALVYSERSVSDPLFMRNMIQALGLFFESELRKAVLGDYPDIATRRTSLKELLMKVSLNLHGMLDGKTESASKENDVFLQLVKWVDSAVKTIESHQVINCLAEENDNRYLFQIPLQFPGGFGTARIFVQCDGHSAKGKERKDEFTVVFSLDMDALGGLMIHARVKGQTLDCTIRCPKDDVRDFLRPVLNRLQDGLTACGFKIGEIHCLTDDKVDEAKEEYFREQIFFGEETVNIFA